MAHRIYFIVNMNVLSHIASKEIFSQKSTMYRKKINTRWIRKFVKQLRADIVVLEKFLIFPLVL